MLNFINKRDIMNDRKCFVEISKSKFEHKEKKRMRRKMNKVLSLSMALVLTLSLIGCGSATNPAIGGDVVESTESTMVSSGDDATATVETDKESTTKTGKKDNSTVDADKPAETAMPTTSPTTAPTATPTAKPEIPEQTASATTQPTQPPHTHDFKVESTVAATCATEGKVVKVCSCGETQTEVIPATGQHDWVEEMEVVTISATGHMETIEQQVQVGTTEARHEYECAYCGHREDSPEALKSHRDSYVEEGNIDHVFARTLIWDYPGEPIYETQTQNVWIEDTPETTTTVGTGRFTCSICGATK